MWQRDLSAFANDLGVVDVVAAAGEVFVVPPGERFGHGFDGGVGVGVTHAGPALQP
ncbi:hypothetical protein D3C83_218860 [compost metagenome]